MKKFSKILLVAILCIFLTPMLSSATSITISDDNSSAHINTELGMDNWTVDGTDQLFKQWFWYRWEADNQEQQIQTVGNEVTSVSLNNRTAYMSWSNDNMLIDIDYTVQGGALDSGTAVIHEGIEVTNLAETARELHFFQYSDFDLGDVGDDGARMVNANTVNQWDGDYALSEVISTPGPTNWEINYYPTLVTSLDDGAVTTLANTPIGSTVGPGDIEWSYEWVVTLGAATYDNSDPNSPVLLAEGGSLIISKDKRIAPVSEPATLLLLGTGLIGLAALGRKKIFKRG